MAYFGGIFFANMGGGGGQNYFQILLRLNSMFSPRCGISGDSWPAILGIVRFEIRDWRFCVPLSSRHSAGSPKTIQREAFPCCLTKVLIFACLWKFLLKTLQEDPLKQALRIPREAIFTIRFKPRGPKN